MRIPSFKRYLAFFSVLLIEASFAQIYPSHPIRVVVPYAPGGVTDVSLRVLQPHLVESLTQQLVVDNRGGASGAIGSKIVASAPPDGYTLLYSDATTLALNMTFVKNVPYDSVKDFTPIGIVGKAELYLVTHPALPARSISELISFLKSSPRRINFASAGYGTALHMAMEAFNYEAGGLNIQHVPFKSGGLAMPELIAGDPPMMVSSLPPVLPYIKAGRLRALGVTAPTRMAVLPDVPAIAETLPGFEFFIVDGFFGPAKLPESVIARLSKEIANITNRPDVKERLIQIGLQPSTSTPQELRDFVAAGVKRFDKIARATGALAEATR